MVNIAVFASGSGTNFENIVNAINDGRIKGAKVKLLLVDKNKAYALERAKKLKIQPYYYNPKAYENKEAFESDILKLLQKEEIDYIVLAGYMRYIGKVLLGAYDNKILNIHPAYLPNFPGKQGILDAYEAKVEYSGVTVHFVDAGVDSGPIILQEKLMIDPSWSLETFEEHIHALEYQIYPKAIQKVIDERKEK